MHLFVPEASAEAEIEMSLKYDTEIHVLGFRVSAEIYQLVMQLQLFGAVNLSIRC